MRLLAAVFVLLACSPAVSWTATRDKGAPDQQIACAKNARKLTDAQVRQCIIDDSIAEYKQRVGNCPCPYNRAKDGSRCGTRSAYDRPGGEEPLCFPKDVSDGMVRDYRKSHALERDGN